MALLICRKQLSEYFKTESSEISTDIIYRLLMVVKKT